MSSEAIDRLFPGVETAGLFLVESYWPGISAARIAAADIETVRALEQLGEGSPASRYLGSVFVPDDELVLRVFAGGSGTLIREANLRAGIPVERVVAVVALPSTH